VSEIGIVATAKSGLTGVTEGSVSEIVSESRRLGKILVKTEGSRNRSCNLRNLKSMREARSVVIALGCKKNLHFMHKPAKAFRMYYSVAVALKIGSDRTFLYRCDSTACIFYLEGLIAEKILLESKGAFLHCSIPPNP
jgi:hypothetical protein